MQVEQIILAPMEGVIDEVMRDLLSNINQFDLCITEFIRVVDSLVPKHIYYKICPELYKGGLTSSNTPVRIQLLGQHPQWMAENAVRAIELGSHGVDLNFGCPSKAVNKSKGGAILLKSPEEIYNITSTVKKALDKNDNLSVKIRLGFDDASLLSEIVDSVVQSNANALTIHARTKKDGYKAPAYWHIIGQIQKKVNIPIIANGEIWHRNDALNCIKQSGTPNIMLGRGILAMPNLAQTIREGCNEMTWPQLCNLLFTFSEIEKSASESFYFSSRLKQWLKYLKINYPEANLLFDEIKKLKDKKLILQLIKNLSS